MKVNNVTRNSFKALIEPYKNEYTNRQEKLADRVRNILASQYPNDKKGRSYIDIYQENFGLDLYIKPNKEEKTIEVLSYDKMEDTYEFMSNYKNIMPKESDFLIFAESLKEKARDFVEKLATVTISVLLFGTIFILGSKKTPVENLEKFKKSELVQNPSKIQDSVKTIIKNI